MFRITATTLALAIAAFRLTADAYAEEPIRWRLDKNGEPVSYLVEQTVTGRMDFFGREVTFNILAKVDLEWQVAEPAGDGHPATITQTITRVRLRSWGLRGEELNYDTKSPPDRPNKVTDAFRPALDRLNRLVGERFSFHMDSVSGKVDDLPEALTRDLENPESFGAFAVMLSPENLRLLTGVGLLEFPDGGALRGRTWVKPPNHESSKNGEAVRTTYRYAKVLDDTPVAVIDVFVGGDREPAGRILFDPAADRIAGFRQTDVAAVPLGAAGKKFSDTVITRTTQMTNRTDDRDDETRNKSRPSHQDVTTPPRPQRRVLPAPAAPR